MEWKEVHLEEAAKRCMIDVNVQVANMLGQSDTVGAIMGSLFLADGPLSLDELVDVTGYGKSTVSKTMTHLENRGLVRRTRRPSDQKNYYVAMPSVEVVFRTEIEKIGQMMQIQIAAIHEANRIMGAERSNEAERLRRLFSTMREECLKTLKLIDLISPFTIDGLIEILVRTRDGTVKM